MLDSSHVGSRSHSGDNTSGHSSSGGGGSGW